MDRIVLFTGKAESGKTTSAKILKEYLEANGKKVLFLNFADTLKFVAKEYFGWDGKKDEKGRDILQYIGTDVVRRKNPNFWVDFMGRFIWVFQDEYDYFILGDWRFKNEYELLYDEWGVLTYRVRVIRTDYENQLTEKERNHPSEIDLDGYPVDYTITCESGIPRLKTCTEFLGRTLLGKE